MEIGHFPSHHNPHELACIRFEGWAGKAEAEERVDLILRAIMTSGQSYLEFVVALGDYQCPLVIYKRGSQFGMLACDELTYEFAMELAERGEKFISLWDKLKAQMGEEVEVSEEEARQAIDEIVAHILWRKYA